MKRHLLIILGGLVVALLGYACVYLQATAVHRSVEKNSRPELAWLQKEYHLSDAQFSAMVELHNAYQPICREMCRRIDARNSKLQQLLLATNTVTPEIKQALAEAAQVRLECQSAMLAHLYEISRLMPPAQGRRYLAWVQQKTLIPGQMVPTSPSAGMANL